MNLFFNLKIKNYFKLFTVALVIFVFIGISQVCQATTSGPNNPATTSDDNSVGTITWTTTGNIVSSDNNYATASLNDNIISHYLKATNFVFTIPSGSTINGITVDIEKKAGTASRIRDYRVRIIKGGLIGATDKSNSNWWGNTDTYTTYGSSSDLWGESWTYSDINNSNFGVAISAYKNSTAGNAIVASIDHIRITISYTANIIPNSPILVSPSNGSSTNDNTPTLSANYSDSDAGDTGTTNYRIATSSVSNCLNNISIVASGTSVETSSNNQNTNWTPSSTVGNDATYYWCAQNNDGVLTSSWTSMGNFILDTISPDTTILTNPTNPSNSNNTSFTFFSEVGATFQCELDGVGYSSCLSPKSYTGLLDGVHTFKVKAIDGVGNFDLTPAEFTWTIITSNPVPTTTSIFPTSKTVGDTDLSLEINGTNFVLNSVVKFDGSERVTTYISETQLTATILASDLLSTGSINITVFSPTPGGGTSNAQILSVNNPVPTTTSISPTSKITGSAEFEITINGTNFVSDSIVNFNGSSRVTTYISSTELTATILATDLTIADNFNITVTNSTPGGGTSGAQIFTVIPGAVNYFTLTDRTSMHVGSYLPYTVSRFDVQNNAVTSGDTTVHLYHNLGITSTTVFYDAEVSGNEITSVDILDGNSSTTFYLYSNDVGDYNIDVTASDKYPNADGSEGIIDATDTISVSAAPISATRFVISDTIPTTVGANASVEIKAKDNAGNVDDSYNGSVSLNTTSPSGSVSPGGIVIITNGIGSINIIDTKAELTSLSLEDTSGSGLNVSSTNNINFLPDVTAKFIMTGATSVIAGERIMYTISRQDQYDNIVTSGINSFYLYTDTISGNFYQNSSGGPSITSASILDGLNSIDIYYTGTLTGSFNVYSSDNPVFGPGILITNGTSAVDINPSVVDNFLVEASGGGNITTKTANVPFDIQITAKDSYDNIATGFNSSVNISSTGILSSGSGTTPSFSSGILSAHSVAISNVGLFNITASSDGQTGTSNNFSVSAAPIVATRFNIIDPLDVQVGQSTIISIEAVDDLGNRADTYDGNIILVASGSATGAGLVYISGGLGTITITDLVAETVHLTLANLIPPIIGQLIFNTTNQDVIFSTTPIVISGGGGGARSITPTVSFTGRAFPQADIEIVAIRDGQVPISSSSTGLASGNFNASFSGELPSSVNTFAVVVYDKDQQIAQTKLFKLGVNDQLSKTILMAPTVSLMQDKITKGAFIGITGSAMPNYQVGLMIDGIKTGQAVTTDSSGNYKFLYNTYPLSLGEHTLRVRQVDSQGVASDYSIEKTFIITKTFVPKADLNNDDKIDIKDWGIFMARYKSVDQNILKTIDMNNDGKTNETDLYLFITVLNSRL
jgi:hypothetical protein